MDMLLISFPKVIICCYYLSHRGDLSTQFSVFRETRWIVAYLTHKSIMAIALMATRQEFKANMDGASFLFWGLCFVYIHILQQALAHSITQSFVSKGKKIRTGVCLSLSL